MEEESSPSASFPSWWRRGGGARRARAPSRAGGGARGAELPPEGAVRDAGARGWPGTTRCGSRRGGAAVRLRWRVRGPVRQRGGEVREARGGDDRSGGRWRRGRLCSGPGRGEGGGEGTAAGSGARGRRRRGRGCVRFGAGRARAGSASPLVDLGLEL